jgi:uncharacterized protein involved in type VI secretion and phage assembly
MFHVYIKIDGRDMAAEFMADLEQVTVETTLHLPAVATLVIHDADLQWIDDAALAPGKALQIETKVSDSNSSQQATLFNGEIVELEPILNSQRYTLLVRAFDRLHRLARGRHTRSFLNQKDSDLAATFAGEAGMQSSADATSAVHEYLLQYNESNLLFLQRRAAANGYLVYADGKKLCFRKPDANGKKVKLSMVENMVEFRPRLSAVEHVDKVQVRGWDVKAKQAVVGQATSSKLPPQVDVKPKDWLKLKPELLYSDCRNTNQTQAQTLAQSLLDRQQSRYIEAEGRTLGQPDLLAGAQVEVSAVGKRFAGTYTVTAATHTLDESGYFVDFSVSGVNPATLLNSLLPEPELPGGDGLVIGIVTNNKDPDGLGRVKVKFPWLSEEDESNWARVSIPGGAAGGGFMSLPEINDEVLVGFQQGDINTPFVLGGLWNGKDKPPLQSDTFLTGSGNSARIVQRAFYSRTGHKITLDDTENKGGVTIEDSNGNRIALNIEKDTLLIKAKGDITIQSEANLALSAKKNITLAADGDVSFDAKGKLDTNAGSGISLDSKGQFAVKATSSAELKSMGLKLDGSPGTTDIKGTMINLN